MDDSVQDNYYLSAQPTYRDVMRVTQMETFQESFELLDKKINIKYACIININIKYSMLAMNFIYLLFQIYPFIMCCSKH